MERDILNELTAWQSSEHRKPLLLKGARQVGKTWVLKQFGATCFENCAYVSLENIAPGVPSEYAQFFEMTSDPQRIVNNLSLALGQPIQPEATLLVLDEIQDCPAALGSLKHFCEELPALHVACAGSLLGVSLARDDGSFPVGKVEFLDMHPLSFSEYLRAVGQGGLDEFARGVAVGETIPELFHERLTEQLQRYFVTGGMPEAVRCWADAGSVAEVDGVLADLLDSYDRDFAKHGGASAYAKLSLVWHCLPTQLSRENKKFVYGAMKQGARAREYEDAIVWLEQAGLLRRVRSNSAHGLPLSAYDSSSAFKLYCLDVGLLRRLSRLDASAFAAAPATFSEFKGAFAENYALQQLAACLDVAPRYWTNDKPRHEVEFLVQVKNTLVPIEVQSGASVTAASLRYYTRKHAETTLVRVRLSLRNMSFDSGMLNIPLYLAHRAVELIEQALEQTECAGA